MFVIEKLYKVATPYGDVDNLFRKEEDAQWYLDHHALEPKAWSVEPVLAVVTGDGKALVIGQLSDAKEIE